MRTCEGLAVIWTKSKVKTGVFFWTSPEVGQKNRLNLGEDLFFVFLFCFGEHPNLDGKTVSISVETFSFLRSPHFGRKIDLI